MDNVEAADLSGSWSVQVPGCIDSRTGHCVVATTLTFVSIGYVSTGSQHRLPWHDGTFAGYKILELSHGLVFDTINREEASDLEVAGKGALACDVKHFGMARSSE